MSTAPDLLAAASAVEVAASVTSAAARHLANRGVELAGGASKGAVDLAIDAHQQVAYDLAHAAAAVENARAVLDYGAKGDVEAALTCAFVADAVHDVTSRLLGREEEWGVAPGAMDAALPFVRTYRAPAFLADLGDRVARRWAGRVTSIPTSRWCRTRSAASPRRR